MNVTAHRIFTMPFAKVYPMYVQKAERKGRAKAEVDQVICWLTGYDAAGLQQQIDQGHDFETFFAQAPAMHASSSLIQGVVCGVRVESIEDPLMRKIRQLDKLVDELAKGKPTTGLVEPMRTEDAHQRHGLARHLLTAGIHRLAEAGATRIKLCFKPGNPAARDLYLGVGFQADRQTLVLSRRAA
jgi:hypothetical protein